MGAWTAPGERSRMRIGLIRVISLEDPEALNAHGEWMGAHYPWLEVESRAIPGFPEGLYNPELERAAVPAILEVGEELAPEVDALAVSCAADPGVAELQERFPHLPVIGAGSALGCICRSLGRKVGFLTITPELPEAVIRGLGDVEYRWEHVPGVHKTTDLARAREAIMAKAKELGARGYGAIGLACTGFSTLRIAPRLREELGIPVIDPVLAMGAVLSLIGATKSPAGRG